MVMTSSIQKLWPFCQLVLVEFSIFFIETYRKRNNLQKSLACFGLTSCMLELKPSMEVQEYLANIFQGRIEYELIYSLRGAKHRVDCLVHIRWDRERYLLYHMIQPKTTLFAHLRDLRLGINHIIKYKRFTLN